MNKKIKLLIVDDSAVVRQTLSKLLEGFTMLDSIDTAPNPIFAFQKIAKNRPDVIISDVEMPQMDGLSFLQKVMSTDPIPMIICSSKTEKGSNNAMTALQFGAIDIIEKPKLGTKAFIEESKIIFQDAIKAASMARVRAVSNSENNQGSIISNAPEPKNTADVILDLGKRPLHIETTEKIIVIGSSTGGTEALRKILPRLPKDCPGILIVQHMPERFTDSFAKSLDAICQMHVKEAENQENVLTGKVLIAQGGKHLLLKRAGMRYYVEVKDGPLVSRHRPSADVLFRSAAKYAGSNCVGAILTGMGYDGAQGMLELHKANVFTIAQDERSCVVYGMPGEAVKKGGVSKIETLDRIPELILANIGYHKYH